VVIVSGICVERDAISAAAAGRAELLAAVPGVDDVVLVSQYHSRRVAVEQVTATNSWEFLRSPVVAAADLVIFHWGVRYDLFNALPIVAAERKVAVQFHNITPAALLDDVGRVRHAESVVQMQLPALCGVPVWTESAYNADALVELGYERNHVAFVPFPVVPPRPLRDRAPRDGTVRLLTVGRLVAAKGVDVLVSAMRQVVDELGGAARLTVIGSPILSDAPFLAALERQVAGLGLLDHVAIRTDVNDTDLWRAYEEAHVLVSPSLHEGLCVPVLEAYHAGCRVVGTDAGNLPFVVQPPDPVVAAGDVAALANAVVDVARQILRDESVSAPRVSELLARYSLANCRATLMEQVARLSRLDVHAR
jgi:glycosyltransferase involved in cell wall biosynthesis